MAKRGKPKSIAPVKMASIAMPEAVKVALEGCTPLQRRFVVNYCGPARSNATYAAQLSGVAGSYSAITSTASNLLHDERVMKAIEIWMEAYAITGARVTAALKDLSEANLGPFVKVSPDGTLKVEVKDEDVWAAYKHWVKSVECEPKTGKVTKLVLHDALVAYRELAKILRLYSDAPVVNLSLHLQKLSNEELIRQWEEATKAAAQPGVQH